MPSILVVEDEYRSKSFVYKPLIEHGYKVNNAIDIQDLLHKIHTQEYDLILTELKIRETNGLDLLKAVKQEKPNIEVIVLTEFGTIESAVSAMKLGAYDYMLKPVNPEELIIKVERAIAHKRMNEEIERLREHFQREYNIGMIVAKSEEMREVLHRVSKVAETDSPIMIQGESGTGKELVAKALHSSGRPGTPFIAINCSALPETLLESELFGYMKGSFTGATVNKKGLFEEAHNGTIFIDEIGDMSPLTQVKLLRALDFGEIRRIGSNSIVYVNARIVVATNKDMEELVKKNIFRRDLYYRLNVVSIYIPPLRKRKADILPLAEHFLKKYSQKMNKDVKRISIGARQLLLKYDWPGNVRELENVIERAIVLTQHDTIDEEDLPSNIRNQPYGILRQASLSRWSYKKLESEYILNVIAECSGNYSQAAKRLGIGRNTLWRKLKEYKNL